jgi:hypothetical protein
LAELGEMDGIEDFKVLEIGNEKSVCGDAGLSERWNVG